MLKKKQKKSSSAGSELPKILVKYGIRVSSPHGAFPEDVERILNDLEQQLVRLSKENKHLESKLTTTSKEKDALKTELTKLKLDISLMEYPDTTSEEDFHMLARMSSIDDSVGEVEAKTLEKPKDNEVLDNLVTETPKRKKQPTKKFSLNIIGGDDYE